MVSVPVKTPIPVVIPAMGTGWFSIYGKPVYMPTAQSLMDEYHKERAAATPAQREVVDEMQIAVAMNADAVWEDFQMKWIGWRN